MESKTKENEISYNCFKTVVFYPRETYVPLRELQEENRKLDSLKLSSLHRQFIIPIFTSHSTRLAF